MKVRNLLIGIVVLFVVGVLTASSYAKIDPKTVAGMWLFDEGNGNIAKDSSGNKNDGTLMNGPKWVDGKFGKALSFDGVDDYVNIGTPSILDITGSITVTAWVKPASSISKEVGFVTKYGSPYSWALRTRPIKPAFTVDNPLGIDHNADGTTTLNPNDWYFITGMFDSKAQKCYIYINGVQETSANGPPSIAGGGTDPVRIGGQNRAGFCFDGTIDEAAVFNVALTENNIMSIMTKGLGVALGITAVSPSDKLAATWASIKTR